MFIFTENRRESGFTRNWNVVNCKIFVHNSTIVKLKLVNKKRWIGPGKRATGVRQRYVFDETRPNTQFWKIWRNIKNESRFQTSHGETILTCRKYKIAKLLSKRIKEKNRKFYFLQKILNKFLGSKMWKCSTKIIY
jgi:hypothetical protein